MMVYISNFFKKKRNLKLAIGALVMANVISANVPSFLGGHAEPLNSIEFETPSTSDITLEEMKNLIYSSDKLTEEEKAFIYNEDLFTDILPYINQSEYMKFTYRSKFSHMDIVNYNNFIANIINADGLYHTWTPSNLYVNNYSGLASEDPTASTAAHEEVHALQYMPVVIEEETDKYYSFFTEPTAEMIAHEYWGAPIKEYKEEIRLIRILMEIIGAEPIKQYIFTGDFSMIEERVRHNLDEEEYAEFLECVKEDVSGNNNLRNARLLDIYQSLYKNIYGQNMREDEVITVIKDNNNSLQRYYFNSRLGDEHFILGEYVTDENGKITIVPIRHDIEPIASRENMFMHTNKIN
nr:hypothetical protein [Bacilli bacterium]